MARPTPYELAFASERFEGDLFPRIREEAERTGAEPLRLEQFNLISAVGAAVREVVPEGAPPEAAAQYRLTLFHAFNLWRSGRRIYRLEPGVARYLVEAAPALRDWDFTAPQASLYLQLPAHLFWGKITPESTPEPVDGLFVTVAPVRDASGRPFQRLDLLMVLGLRRDRAGFSVIPIGSEAGPGIPAVWAEAPGREGGADFENILPGGEIRGLYSLLTTAEVLKLTGRALWYVDRFPRDLSEVAEPPHPPFTRVALGEGEEP
ncbi:MAG TPA: hypothetical protein VFI96_00605 [Longimicrobiaceae bacterium]|nr:hypothetical protein [Longimicrobiaceae bacterium]